MAIKKRGWQTGGDFLPIIRLGSEDIAVNIIIAIAAYLNLAKNFIFNFPFVARKPA